ncbi:lipoyl protein ligase domain-containing protein [Roseibacillus persicicus]|uniref:Lipoate--protein ligase A n=1 Tax=Roseibacillus persicicus TaxID=454148 RepID=A0A918TTR3_9BACT|nr:lipoate--protein ligase family protein [Roseibacillus persicicus]GHC61540.1 lipoate--protein ligase A [Roseibacillus persicicus]
MQLIQDPPADGPTNMQRDLDLLETLGDEPLLRFYQWSGNWASYGYFQSEADAIAHFPNADLHFVKRPTGGGIVDHREDLTYTLLIPKSHKLAQGQRADSYYQIHQAAQRALTACGLRSQLLEKEEGEGPACFVHPVPGDLIDATTRKKLAGAAQRRTRHGLLHQGSILLPGLIDSPFSSSFYQHLQEALAEG